MRRLLQRDRMDALELERFAKSSRAHRARVSCGSADGREPLLRADLPEIVGSAQPCARMKLFTTGMGAPAVGPYSERAWLGFREHRSLGEGLAYAARFPWRLACRVDAAAPSWRAV